MRSMSSVISAHNCSTLNPPKTSFGCNCQKRSMSVAKQMPHTKYRLPVRHNQQCI